MINYESILNKNLINVLKDILNNIYKNGLKNNNHLYITFLTNHKKVEIPTWLKKKFPNEITIVIQYEYSDLLVYDDYFLITLSFDDIKTKLKVDFESIISFADPSANFGLKLKEISPKEKNNSIRKNKPSYKNNIIDFANYKKD